MKKIVLTSLSLLLFSLAALSQDEGGSFGEGTSVVNLGVGIGTFYWGSGVTNSLGINPTISYEYGVTDKFGVGGNLSYSAAKYSANGFSVKYSGLLIGPRGAYHFANSVKFDPYVGATLGYVIVSVKDNSGGNYTAKGSGLGLGIFLGGRYYPSSSVGIHAEIGYTSFSFLTAGVTFRF